MTKCSAGIILYRESNHNLEVFLGHMGGPFWSRKDEGAWSIPKGEFDPEKETPLDAAIREFHEETGMRLEGPLIELNPIRQKSGKVVYCWAAKGDLNPQNLSSNLFELEWPPKSGKKQFFPELDRGAWFSIDAAATKMVKGQVLILDQLMEKVKNNCT